MPNGSLRSSRRPASREAARCCSCAWRAVVLAGCESIDTGTASRAAMNEAIRKEPAGNYFIGRRMYKVDYKSGAGCANRANPGASAKLVMLNEQRVLAPDRARSKTRDRQQLRIPADRLFLRRHRLRTGKQRLLPGIYLARRRGEVNQSAEHLHTASARTIRKLVSWIRRLS